MIYEYYCGGSLSSFSGLQLSMALVSVVLCITETRRESKRTLDIV